MKTTIDSIEDIKNLVDHFYLKVREDELLSPIFNTAIGENWPSHLQKMYNFWQTVLLDEHTYYGSPFLPHASLPINKHHFEQWLSLFEDTVDALFTGKKAEEAKWRAHKMAEMFLLKLEHHRNNNTKPLL